jgi:hypothetical protein
MAWQSFTLLHTPIAICETTCYQLRRIMAKIQLLYVVLTLVVCRLGLWCCKLLVRG